MTYRIRNWNEFQHFKDRMPPWIKLHKRILDQRDINVISDRSFRVLIGLWLLASEDKEMQGGLPEIADIAFRLRMPERDLLKAFQELTPFLERDDINAISTRYQVDEPETETETYTETEGETEERAREGKPKQQKLPGTQRMPFKDRAAACGYWDFHRLYPEHRRIDPKRVLPLWEAAIKEEPELTRRTITEYVQAMIDLGEWTKDNGRYCPGMVKFFDERHWERKPVRTGKLEIKENHDPDDDKPFGKKIIC